MAKKLRTFVTVQERDEKGNPTGRTETFGPNDTLPPWAEASITNPDVWEDSDSDQAVTLSDPGNSGPASVEIAGGEGGQPTAQEAEPAVQEPGRGDPHDAEVRPAKSTRRVSGR